jgi:hypothetical protein
MNPCWSAEKAFRTDAKAVPKMVGEFLKPHGNRVQISCPFSPVLEYFHWKAKIGWLCGPRWMQKNASLRSRQVKNFTSAGTKPKSMYEFGTMGCKMTIAELLPGGRELARNPQSLLSGLVIRGCSRMTDKVRGSHILRVCQRLF